MTMSNYLEDAIANALRGGGNGVSFTAPAAVYVKLHTGDPGEAGTSNAAGNTTRQAGTFGASSGGVITSNADITWTSVSTTETYSHVSLWDNSTAGNCLGSGALTSSRAVTAGDTFRIASGQLTFTFT
jgi:nitrous oxide reductase accessory protein NosL